MTDGDTLRLAALADLHYGRDDRKATSRLLDEAGEAGDVLLLCGDLTDHGRPDEADKLVRDVDAEMRGRTLCVLGNHDHASDQGEDVAAILDQAGMRVFDGDYAIVDGVGFVGVTGFCGGFGGRAVQPFGERPLREFVGVTVDEALKLETALSQSNVEQRIALLHYAPIKQTIEGEPLELYPFLGASRLEDPLNQYEVDAVFHGHAHHGAPQGETSSGIPVFNVSVPLLQHTSPDAPAFRLFELETE